MVADKISIFSQLNLNLISFIKIVSGNTDHIRIRKRDISIVFEDSSLFMGNDRSLHLMIFLHIKNL